VRFEPYVVPKRSLTGDSTERVDTRVLQAIYSFDRGDLTIYSPDRRIEHSLLQAILACGEARGGEHSRSAL